jgi:hypothetical protein
VGYEVAVGAGVEPSDVVGDHQGLAVEGELDQVAKLGKLLTRDASIRSHEVLMCGTVGSFFLLDKIVIK